LISLGRYRYFANSEYINILILSIQLIYGSLWRPD